MRRKRAPVESTEAPPNTGATVLGTENEDAVSGKGTRLEIDGTESNTKRGSTGADNSEVPWYNTALSAALESGASNVAGDSTDAEVQWVSIIPNENGADLKPTTRKADTQSPGKGRYILEMLNIKLIN